jgi:putative membrane protein
MSKGAGPPDDGAESTSLSASTAPGGQPWWEQGEEPDYRATLANERTYLAWIRTALGLLVGALAVVKLAPEVPKVMRLILSFYLVVAALAAQLGGYRRWQQRQHRMRLGRPLGHPRTPLATSIGFTVLIGLVAIAITIAAGH